MTLQLYPMFQLEAGNLWKWSVRYALWAIDPNSVPGGRTNEPAAVWKWPGLTGV